MKKALIAALAVTTALTGMASGGVASAQPGPYHDQDRGYDHDRGYARGHDRDHDGVPDRVERWQRDDWRRDHDRWSHGQPRYWGGRYGYNGYNGRWRTGQRYGHWHDSRYVISDYRAYRLPPPRPGYRYYRDDSGDIVMVAITSGIIGLIVGNAMSH